MAYFYFGETLLALTSGALGVVATVLCAQRNILHFFFGFAQIITYSVICWEQNLYSALAINAFYFIAQIYGIFHWKHHLQDDDSLLVEPKKMPIRTTTLYFLATLIASALIGAALQRFTADKQPFLDAFTTVPAIVAQIMMVRLYKEQYYFWIFIDIFSVIMWLKLSNYCLASQYLFWTANAFYGLWQWGQSKK